MDVLWSDLNLAQLCEAGSRAAWLAAWCVASAQPGLSGDVRPESSGRALSSALTSQAKTAVAPLDRVKILFQTSNADFLKYQGELRLNALSGVARRAFQAD